MSISKLFNCESPLGCATKLFSTQSIAAAIKRSLDSKWYVLTTMHIPSTTNHCAGRLSQERLSFQSIASDGHAQLWIYLLPNVSILLDNYDYELTTTRMLPDQGLIMEQFSSPCPRCGGIMNGH